MSYELQGSVLKVFDTEVVGSKGFEKREFVVSVMDGKYSQEIKLELHNNHDCLDKVREGDMVKVEFNLRGNEWKGRHFVNLVAWNIDVEGKTNRPAQTQDSHTDPDPDEDEDDLFPF